MEVQPVLRVVSATITRIMWCETCESTEHGTGEAETCSGALVEMGWQEAPAE